MRARGLKRVIIYPSTVSSKVAPHAGAWIETIYNSEYFNRWKVAPHAGAWIETTFGDTFLDMNPVAPHAGAWIETW